MTLYMGVFFLIHYRNILELNDEGTSLRGISARNGHSCRKVTEVIVIAVRKGVTCPLD
jgi:hypothetical protein